MSNNVKTLISLTIFLLTIGILNATDLELPEIHTNIVLQTNAYFGDDVVVQDSSWQGTFENIIYKVPDSKFTVRSVMIEAIGKFGKNIEYNMEFGMSTCPFSGAETGFGVKEAGVFYKPFEWIRLGLMKGHIMRGFEIYQCCTEVLTVEKPHSGAAFIGQCHATGAVVEADYDISESMGFSTQLAFLNGFSGKSFDKEYDRNIGLIFRTPLDGVSIGGYYNDIKQDLGKTDPITFEPIYKKSNRMGFGAEFDFHNIFVRGEYYTGKGFTSIFPDTIKTSENLEMNAFYIEGAYTIKTNWDIIPYIQPYFMYQSWNKASNVDGYYWNNAATFIDDTIYCDDFVSSYFTAGITLGLDEEHTKLRIDYEVPVDVPDNEFKEAKKLIVRLQSGF
ncbi:MAG: hypothetical protein U9R23_00160 [Candidatus Cloacimonadota bacterium]|nr:hypothetical protein [Candidatus Cloacimonadota bacterium]